MGIWTPHYIKENYSCHSLMLFTILSSPDYDREQGIPSSRGDPCSTGRIGIPGSPLYREDGDGGPHSTGKIGIRGPRSTGRMGTRDPRLRGSPIFYGTGQCYKQQ